MYKVLKYCTQVNVLITLQLWTLRSLKESQAISSSQSLLLLHSKYFYTLKSGPI